MRAPVLPALAALSLLAGPAAAQAVPDAAPRDTAPPPSAPRAGLQEIGSLAEDRSRLRQLLGEEPADGFLLRSPSSRLDRPAPGSGLRVRAVAPRAALTWNSRIPYSLNDGAMWAGKGANASVTTGVRVDAGRVTLVLAPTFAYSANQDFQVFPARDGTRSDFASPWYAYTRSADLPLRFGTDPYRLVDPGQSSLTVHTGPVAFGAATENQWWGPGIRNAIVLSNHAAGFPHAFLRTARPLRTPLGEVEARWIVGQLTQSVYFDTVPRGGSRSLSGFVGTLRPGDGGLTLGVARVVYARARARAVAFNALDVFTETGPRTPAGDSVPSAGPEQIFSIFGRWVLPADGAEVYAEWARSALPASPSDFMEAPNHSQGYTLGFQWARPTGADAALRLQGELTYLELSPTVRYRRVPTFYTSASVPQGYTQRGQVLGAAIGPGSSSQWLAADYLAERWSAGVFAGRVRWEDDAHNYSRPFYEWQVPGGRSNLSHDVSILGGIRGDLRLRGYGVGVEVTRAHRHNYLFQNPDLGFTVPSPPGSQVDVWNTTVRLSVTPRP